PAASRLIRCNPPQYADASASASRRVTPAEPDGAGSLAKLTRPTQLRRRRSGSWPVLVLRDARQHLLCEQREIVDRIRVRHRPGVPHHQEIAHPSAIIAELDQLRIDLI